MRRDHLVDDLKRKSLNQANELLEKLSKLHPRAYWIEDKPVNAVLGLKFGLRPILITHPYNKDFKVPEGVIRANDWKDIFDIIHVFKR